MKKIDLIIDALSVAESSVWSDKIAEALAAARELRALKPVAWGAKSIYGGFEGMSFYESSRFETPLYALDGEQL